MIFFDVDETLLDFKGAEFLSVKATYDIYGERFYLSENEFYSSWCSVGKKYFEQYLKGQLTFEQQKIVRVKEVFSLASIALSDAEAYDIFQVYLCNFENNWRPFDDVVPCLEQLKRHRLGILSNGESKQQNLKLEKIGIRNYFEVIVTAGDAGVAKPSTRIFEIAC